MESFLGPIDAAWSETASGERLPFKIVRFRASPFPSATTYVTLGVGDVALDMPRGRSVRQELLLACHDRFPAAGLVTMLHDVAVDVVRRGHAVLRGQAWKVDADLPGTVTSLYGAVPVYHPSGFEVWRDSQPPTVFVWLVPITESERRFVEQNGWESFEAQLEAQDPDLLDLEREGLRLA